MQPDGVPVCHRRQHSSSFIGDFEASVAHDPAPTELLGDGLPRCGDSLGSGGFKVRQVAPVEILDQPITITDVEVEIRHFNIMLWNA